MHWKFFQRTPYRLLIKRYIIFAVIFFGFASVALGQLADVVFFNGKIWTGETADSFVESIAIKADKIIAVGNEKMLQPYLGSQTKKIDLKGKLMTAGFDDSHIHFLSGSLLLTEVNLVEAKKIEEIRLSIARYAEKNIKRQWITGRGWLYEVFGTQLPNKKILDSLINNRPVFLKAYDGHTGWVNSKALDLAGITKNFVFTGFGEVVRDSSGEPTGILKEDAMTLVEKIIPSYSFDEKIEAMKQGLQLAASFGITSFQNAKGSASDIDLYKKLLNEGELTARIAAAFTIDEKTTDDDIATFEKIKINTPNSSMLRVSTAKIILDGVIESHTAAMLDPYSDSPGIKGELSMPEEKYYDLITKLDKARFRIFTHAIGDRAVRVALNVYEKAIQTNGTSNARHRIEHIELISESDLLRFEKLGVLPSMQPIHADPATTIIWEKAVGPERLNYAFAWSSLLQSKAHLIFGSDWPACISLNPIRGIHVAVNRRTPQGFPSDGWVADQKISIYEAMKAYTQGGTYSSFEENVKGKILPGYFADLIILSDNLFTIQPMKIHQTKVVMTMMGGRIVFMNESLKN